MGHHLWPGGRPGVLALWSAPRCRSTAFARMIAERGDFTTLHEPFSHLKDFGVVQVGPAVARDEPGLIAAIRALAESGPVFFKDTTDFHYPGLLADQALLSDAVHTFIVRHPAAAITSHYALNPQLGRDEIGFAWLAEIYEAVKAVSPAPPVVIDSDLLVRRPTEVVNAYCAAVGIPFVPGALSWNPGMRAEWQRTSRWHESTSSTSGFASGPERDDEARAFVAGDPVLAEHLEYHLPFYEKLRQAALSA
jgi:hypothetical protein